jgi:hypothetical protein
MFEAPAPLDTIPVFVREGAIVPRGDLLRSNDNWTPDWRARLRVEIFPGDGSVSRSFVYFTGTRAVTITAATDGGKLTVTLPALELPGDLEVQTDRAGRVLRDGKPLTEGSDYQLDRQARVLRIPFQDAASFVVEDVGSPFAASMPALPPAPDAGPLDAAPPVRDAAAPRDAAVHAGDGVGCRCDIAGPRRRVPPATTTPLMLAAIYWFFRRRLRQSNR